jgi:hypothetical protein
MYPDVRVIEASRPKRKIETRTVDGAMAEPLVLVLSDEPVTEGYIQIIDVRSGRRVITVIEFLSRSNKFPGPGRDLYQEKQQQTLAARASLVEIDLLRSGSRDVLSVPPESIPDTHRTTYQVIVRRGWRLGQAEIYPVPLRERLPTIRIPLRRTDDDVPLNLQALLNRVYRTGGYDEDIDYQLDPDPPLSPDDAAWADALLRRKGRRPRRPGRKR